MMIQTNRSVTVVKEEELEKSKGNTIKETRLYLVLLSLYI